MTNVRTTKPTKSDKYFIRQASGGYSTCVKGKPTDVNCDALANCVGYACGAFNEELGLGYEKYHLNCNAENFIERAIAAGLSVVKDPVVGSIMVWQKGATLKASDGAGHVAIVIEVIDSNTIRTAESAYGGSCWFIVKRTNNNGKWGAGADYKYRGCIPNPNIKEESIPVPTPIQEPTSQPASNESKFKVGDNVVPIKLVNWKGTHLKQYDKYYTITTLKDNVATLSAKRKGKMEIWARLYTDNIKLYKD